jgi:hypothetical protein
LGERFKKVTPNRWMLKAADERQREAKLKDKDEIEQKRQEYQDFMDWKDRGILFDLEKRFQIVNPTLSLLLPIALNMSTLIDVQLGRQEKRRRDLLIGWLNKNYGQIQKYIPRMVIKNERGEIKGPNVDMWKKYVEDNPDADIHNFLSKQ